MTGHRMVFTGLVMCVIVYANCFEVIILGAVAWCLVLLHAPPPFGSVGQGSSWMFLIKEIMSGHSISFHKVSELVFLFIQVTASL